MPVNQEMMSKLKSQYGSEKGERMYYILERKNNKKKPNLKDKSTPLYGSKK